MQCPLPQSGIAWTATELETVAAHAMPRTIADPALGAGIVLLQSGIAGAATELE